MRAQDFVKKRPVKTLTIFDIDDTLFHTTAKIKVVKDGKVLRTLSNQEFNTYELEPGEEFDFGEFRNAEKFRQESEPIEHMLDELKTILDTTKGTVIMLTARADFDDKETFLKTFADHGIDMSRIHVHRAGNLPGDAIPAEKKAVWVRRYLDTGKYNQVSLYDDSMSNLRVFKSLKQEYPDVDFDAYFITPDDVTAVEGRGKKRKRKPKYAYGAPYGWYGMDAGYSGDGGGGGDGGGMEETSGRRRWSWSKPGWFSRLEDYDVEEASYPGNIGVMELIKFFKEASPSQQEMFKKLVNTGEKKLAWFLVQKVTGVKLQGDEFNSEDYHPNDPPVGPETKPAMPKGTIKVDVSDVYDWYKLGQHISRLKGLGKHDFGKGPPSAILSFGDEDLEHEYINALKKTGLSTTDIDPKSHEKKKGQKVDPTYDVGENFADGKNPGRKGLSKRMGVNTKASVSSLRKTAKNSSGEKQRMAHWLANMKSGRQKSK